MSRESLTMVTEVPGAEPVVPTKSTLITLGPEVPPKNPVPSTVNLGVPPPVGPVLGLTDDTVGGVTYVNLSQFGELQASFVADEVPPAVVTVTSTWPDG
jgi:hypothetical protein